MSTCLSYSFTERYCGADCACDRGDEDHPTESDSGSDGKSCSQRYEPHETDPCGYQASWVRVALDDFGTGYSSLNHIREMPIDVIKIDRCFIIDIGKDDFSNAFVKWSENLQQRSM